MPDDVLPYITIVSGLPRSGTSMMMQMLAAGGMPVLSDGQRVADDDNPRGYFELEAVKATRRDAAWVRDAPGRAVKVIHLLLPALPVAAVPYRVVFMRRPMDQVLRSQSVMLERSGKPSPPSTAGLAKVFSDQLALADRFLHERPDVVGLDVDYADAVDHPQEVAERVAAFFHEASLDIPAMVSAVDPSLCRQR